MSEHLKAITLEGFKSIKKMQLDFGPINFLIGANGSGKSNFISLFQLLSHLSQGRLQAYLDRSGGADVFFHFGSKNTDQIKLDIQVGNNGYHVTLEADTNNDRLIFTKEECSFTASGPGRYPVSSDQKGESGLLSGSTPSTPVRDYTRNYLQSCRVYHFHDTSSTAGFKKTVDLQADDYLYPSAENLAAFLYRLKQQHSTSYNSIVTAIRSVAPFFHDFYLEPRGDENSQNILLKWLNKDHDGPLSANQLSDGTARFICLATLLLQPYKLRPHTIILDEPELGLHPAALDVLADMIKQTAAEDQIICATQSIRLANHFDPEHFIVVDQKEGESEYSKLDPELLQDWLADYGVGDIWVKSLIGGRPQC